MAAQRRTVYVGGLAEEVTEDILTSAFIPFGDIMNVQLPLNPANNKHRGFGFVTYEDADDASEAVDNMDNGELFGRVLRVNLAKPMSVTENSRQAVWSDQSTADEWLKKTAEERAAEEAAQA